MPPDVAERSCEIRLRARVYSPMSAVAVDGSQYSPAILRTSVHSLCASDKLSSSKFQSRIHRRQTQEFRMRSPLRFRLVVALSLRSDSSERSRHGHHPHPEVDYRRGVTLRRCCRQRNRPERRHRPGQPVYVVPRAAHARDARSYRRTGFGRSVGHDPLPHLVWRHVRVRQCCPFRLGWD